ncbi:MAG: peptidoglycan DD-metalloendopeptidase family protein [Gammaproteobacteria bacterium]|nr:peptidoglycan DD-metalloendopeptidase family protein [Gammaproteobacteria bacterium]
MRATPDSLRTHLLASIPISAVLLVVAVSSMVGYAHASETTQSVESVEYKLEETAARLDKLRLEIEANRQLKAELNNTLNAVASKASERESRLAELDNQLTNYTNKLNSLQTMIDTERSLLQQRKHQLAEALRSSLQVGSNSGLKVLLQSNDPAEASRLNVYTEYVMRAQHQLIDRQLQTLSEIEKAHTDALENRNWVQYLQKKATKQYSEYVEIRSAKTESLKTVEQEIDKKSRSVATLKADRERLQVLMEELKQAQLAASGYFENGKGRYALPVAGSIEARFGDVKSVGKLNWTGLFLRAQPGQPVRSIANGEVVYSDWLQGFGMLVIIDHGDSYMTLYGGNRDVRVASGAWVEAGATIATVGDSGGQKHSGLYFEIRHNAKPVDPEQWVGAKNSFRNAKL